MKILGDFCVHKVVSWFRNRSFYCTIDIILMHQITKAAALMYNCNFRLYQKDFGLNYQLIPAFPEDVI